MWLVARGSPHCKVLWKPYPQVKWDVGHQGPWFSLWGFAIKTWSSQGNTSSSLCPLVLAMDAMSPMHLQLMLPLKPLNVPLKPLNVALKPLDVPIETSRCSCRLMIRLMWMSTCRMFDERLLGHDSVPGYLRLSNCGPVYTADCNSRCWATDWPLLAQVWKAFAICPMNTRRCGNRNIFLNRSLIPSLDMSRPKLRYVIP